MICNNEICNNNKLRFSKEKRKKKKSHYWFDRESGYYVLYIPSNSCYLQKEVWTRNSNQQYNENPLEQWIDFFFSKKIITYNLNI